MRRLLQAGWELPWPAGIRRLAGRLITAPGMGAILFPRFMVGVVGVIEDGDGRVLVVHHTYRHDYPWGLPTGFLEHGEQPDAALHREVLEETGLDIRLTTLYEVYVDTSRPLLDVVYRGRHLAGSFRASAEIDEARFCSVTELPPLRPDQADLIREVARRSEESHEALA